MSDVLAKSATRNNVTYLTAYAVASPAGGKAGDCCGAFPDARDGADCYLVCGEIPRDRKPVQVRFYWRPSHQGDATPWVLCPGDGCETTAHEYHAQNSTVCGWFKLWKGAGGQRDLMMKVVLA